MAKAEATVEELVRKIERGELRLPEMQRRYVWRSTLVRDLLDSLYRGYPSGAILIWETDEPVLEQDFAVGQQANPYAKTQLLFDGLQPIGRNYRSGAASEVCRSLSSTNRCNGSVGEGRKPKWA